MFAKVILIATLVALSVGSRKIIMKRRRKWLTLCFLSSACRGSGNQSYWRRGRHFGPGASYGFAEIAQQCSLLRRLDPEQQVRGAAIEADREMDDEDLLSLSTGGS